MTGTLFQARRWLVGDRCRTVKFGEWKNGTIIGFAYEGDVAIVQRDAETSWFVFYKPVTL